MKTRPKLIEYASKLAYDLVLDHYKNNVKEPLLMILTGTAGCGKSFVINCIRQVLGGGVLLPHTLKLLHLILMENYTMIFFF